MSNNADTTKAPAAVTTLSPAARSNFIFSEPLEQVTSATVCVQDAVAAVSYYQDQDRGFVYFVNGLFLVAGIAGASFVTFNLRQLCILFLAVAVYGLIVDDRGHQVFADDNLAPPAAVPEQVLEPPRPPVRLRYQPLEIEFQPELNIPDFDIIWDSIKIAHLNNDDAWKKHQNLLKQRIIYELDTEAITEQAFLETCSLSLPFDHSRADRTTRFGFREMYHPYTIFASTAKQQARARQLKAERRHAHETFLALGAVAQPFYYPKISRTSLKVFVGMCATYATFEDDHAFADLGALFKLFDERKTIQPSREVFFKMAAMYVIFEEGQTVYDGPLVDRASLQVFLGMASMYDIFEEESSLEILRHVRATVDALKEPKNCPTWLLEFTKLKGPWLLDLTKAHEYPVFIDDDVEDYLALYTRRNKKEDPIFVGEDDSSSVFSTCGADTSACPSPPDRPVEHDALDIKCLVEKLIELVSPGVLKPIVNKSTFPHTRGLHRKENYALERLNEVFHENIPDSKLNITYPQHILDMEEVRVRKFTPAYPVDERSGCVYGTGSKQRPYLTDEEEGAFNARSTDYTPHRDRELTCTDIMKLRQESRPGRPRQKAPIHTCILDWLWLVADGIGLVHPNDYGNCDCEADNIALVELYRIEVECNSVSDDFLEFPLTARGDIEPLLNDKGHHRCLGEWIIKPRQRAPLRKKIGPQEEAKLPVQDLKDALQQTLVPRADDSSILVPSPKIVLSVPKVLFPSWYVEPVSNLGTSAFEDSSLGRFIWASWYCNDAFDPLYDGSEYSYGSDYGVPTLPGRPVLEDVRDIEFMLRQLPNHVNPRELNEIMGAGADAAYRKRSLKDNDNMAHNALLIMWHVHKRTDVQIPAWQDLLDVEKKRVSRRRPACLHQHRGQQGPDSYFRAYLTKDEEEFLNMLDSSSAPVPNAYNFQGHMENRLHTLAEHEKLSGETRVTNWVLMSVPESMLEPNWYECCSCGNLAANAVNTYHAELEHGYEKISSLHELFPTRFLGPESLNDRIISQQMQIDGGREAVLRPRCQHIIQDCMYHDMETDSLFFLLDTTVYEPNDRISLPGGPLPVPGYASLTKYPDGFQTYPHMKMIKYHDLTERCVKCQHEIHSWTRQYMGCRAIQRRH